MKEIRTNKTIPAVTINRTDPVVFDFTAWAKTPGVLQLWHRPHGAPVAHKVALRITGSRAYWTASEEDPPGKGDAMIFYFADSGSVRKSNVFTALVG